MVKSRIHTRWCDTVKQEIRTKLNCSLTLLEATQRGQLETVQKMIEEGAAVDTRGNNGYTPLLLASEANHLNIAEFLIEKKAN